MIGVKSALNWAAVSVAGARLDDGVGMNGRGGQAKHKTSPQGESVSELVHSSDLPGLIRVVRHARTVMSESIRNSTRRPENVPGRAPRAKVSSSAGRGGHRPAGAVPARLRSSRVPLPLRPAAREHPRRRSSPSGCPRLSSGRRSRSSATPPGTGPSSLCDCLGPDAGLAKASGTLSGTAGTGQPT